MSEIIESKSNLNLAQNEWLHLLVEDWQVISDLAFADLVLWIKSKTGPYVAIAQCRPSTGVTTNYDDVVGSQPPERFLSYLTKAYETREIQRLPESSWLGEFAVKEELTPVVFKGQVIAIIARQTNLGTGRAPSRLEHNYVSAAETLLGMVSQAAFPDPDSGIGPRRGAPRVTDGLIRLDPDGEVLYASPNALSCFHRLGALGGLEQTSLIEITAALVEQGEKKTVDEALPLVMMGKAPWLTEVETRSAVLSIRSIPLSRDGKRTGAILLCRDVSEVRRRERQLITKDATIREIHHRVKNNLQTVAALLRLQARRVNIPEAKEALGEAMRRVSTIALVHESLSQTLDEEVEFDQMVGRALALAIDVAAAGVQVRAKQSGSFGLVPAEDATPLALALTELVTNAVEHGFAQRKRGSIEVKVERIEDSVNVWVRDDGVGMKDSVHPQSGLGTQIVQTLITNELGGSIRWQDREGGGTEVVISLNLRVNNNVLKKNK